MINMKKMNKKQAGFTLIELVMVIVILGILSAFALPRFADLTGDARAASISGLAGALKSGAAISHAQQLADGTGVGMSVVLEGATVTMANGYPTSLATGISVATNIDTNDDTPASTATTMTYTIPGYTSSPVNTCQVVYTAATASAIYEVEATTTGC